MVLTMRMIWDEREWDVNKQHILHIFIVSLKILLQPEFYQQVVHTDSHVIYGKK